MCPAPLPLFRRRARGTFGLEEPATAATRIQRGTAAADFAARLALVDLLGLVVDPDAAGDGQAELLDHRGHDGLREPQVLGVVGRQLDHELLVAVETWRSVEDAFDRLGLGAYTFMSD